MTWAGTPPETPHRWDGVTSSHQRQGVLAGGPREQRTGRDQLPEQGDLVVRGGRGQPPARPGEPGTDHARRRRGVGQAGPGVERADPGGPADRVPQAGRGVVVAVLDHLLGQRPVAGRQPGAVALAALGQQRLEDVELDDARLGLRPALAQMPGAAGAQIVDGGQDGAGPARQVRGRGRPERIPAARRGRGCRPRGSAGEECARGDASRRDGKAPARSRSAGRRQTDRWSRRPRCRAYRPGLPNPSRPAPPRCRRR